jgi:hypothetical protein
MTKFGAERLAKLPDAVAELEQAIANETPITMADISRAVGKYSGWLQGLCKQGCQEALDLRQRIDAHNKDINSRYRWNRLLDNRRCHLFKSGKMDYLNVGKLNNE